MSCTPPDMRAPLDPGSPVTAEQAEATLTRLLAAAAAKGYEKGRDDERARCTRHAHALAGRAFAGTVGYPDVLATTEAISSGKAAP